MKKRCHPPVFSCGLSVPGRSDVQSDPAVQRLERVLRVHTSIENASEDRAGERTPPARCPSDVVAELSDSHRLFSNFAGSGGAPEAAPKCGARLLLWSCGRDGAELIGLREVTDSDFPSRATLVVNSSKSMVEGHHVHVHVLLVLSLHLRHFLALVFHLLCCLLLLVHMLLSHPCMMHRIQLFACAEVHQLQLGWLQPGSHGLEAYQRWGFPSGRRFAYCLRGGGRSKISACPPSTSAGCCALFPTATRTRNQACEGLCGELLFLLWLWYLRISILWHYIIE